MWGPNRTAARAQRTPSVHSVASVYSITSPQIQSQTKPVVAAGHNNKLATLDVGRPTDAFVTDDRSGSGHQDLSFVAATWEEQQVQMKSMTEQQKEFIRSENALKDWGGTTDDTTSVTDDRSGTGHQDLSFVAVTWEEQQAQMKSMTEQQKEFIRSANALKDWEGTTDDTSSRSSTLDGEDDYMETVQKKSSLLSELLTTKEIRTNERRSPLPAQHIPGPLESQLAALMSKLIYLEHANPAISITLDEHEALRKRVEVLEEEKKHWWKRHEAIWALRDEDVENNIKIRGLLAKARRELELTKALREEDLSNVQSVRAKLAEKTRELDRLQAQSGRASPHRGRPASFFERRGTSDLFVAAKTAALEQRALELEKRNSDLVEQVETLKGGADIDDLNRFTAHQAWKDTVGDLEAKVKAKDAELTRLRAGSGSTGGGMDWLRVEAAFEEHANYREAIGGKLQALRSDKESLQRELHRKENECQALELKLQSVHRRSKVL